MSRDGSVVVDVSGTVGDVVGSTSSAPVVVVVDVGMLPWGVVVLWDGVVLPCVVVVVDVTGTLGELGVMTVEPLVVDEPLGAEDVAPDAGAGVVCVLSASDTLARVVAASMVALTIKNL
jgi:hypothetical protein